MFSQRGAGRQEVKQLWHDHVASLPPSPFSDVTATVFIHPPWLINTGTSNLGEEGACLISHFQVTALQGRSSGWTLKAGTGSRNHAGVAYWLHLSGWCASERLHNPEPPA